MQATFPSHVRRLDASDAGAGGMSDDPIDRLAYELVAAFRVRPGDLVLCVAGERLPARLRVLEGDGLVQLDTSAACPPESIERSGDLPIGAALVSGYLIGRVESP